MSLYIHVAPNMCIQVGAIGDIDSPDPDDNYIVLLKQKRPMNIFYTDQND